MSCLAEKDPELVHAAGDALNKVEPVGPECARTTTFVHNGQEYWTKMTMDPVANTIEKWDVFPVGVRNRW